MGSLLGKEYEGARKLFTHHCEKRSSQLPILCRLIKSASGLLRPAVSLSFGVFLFLGHFAASQHGHQVAGRDVKTKSNQQANNNGQPS